MGLVGFIGKIPACGDFVRQHIGSKISAELERWLNASTQNLYAGKHDLGPACLRFVFSAPGCDDVAVGTLNKSVDSVGRSYPLAIFTSLSAAEMMAQPAALPTAFATFLDQAENLLAQVSTLPIETLRERVTGLTPPSQQEIEAAAQHATTQLGNVDAASAISNALDGEPEDAGYYALLTLCTATSAVPLAPASGAPTVLDCPLEPQLGPALWLSLTAARLRWTQGALSLLWAADATRLLIALGHASDQMLSLYVAKLHTSTRLWPLTTTRPEAIARAKTLLEPLLHTHSVAALAQQLTTVSC